MDRIIKFRGKRIDNREWVYGSLILCAGRMFIVDELNETALRSVTTHHADRYDFRSVKVDPETVGQFTGMTDKGGDGIYEWDIVDILCDDGETGLIKWDKDTARFVVSANGFEADFDNYFGADLEVIGNIYDSPELTEENDNED